MNVASIRVLLMSVGILLMVGCVRQSHFPQSSLTGNLFEVKITDSLTPPVVTAKQGDEVRWVNMTSGPVDISLVQTQDNLVSCQKGFAATGLGNLVGSLEYDTIVIATVLQNDSASLCFAIPGKYVYTVRWNPPMTGHARTITGSLTIE